MLRLEPDGSGVRRRKKAFIFTRNVSRYRFVYPIDRETTEEAIAACEAAWTFYGGIFRAMVVDNMKAIVTRADPLEAKINPTFQEYAQAHGFFVDATRHACASAQGQASRRATPYATYATTASPASACSTSLPHMPGRPGPRSRSRCLPASAGARRAPVVGRWVAI